MESRTGKQCRERYINQLDPDVKKTAWTAEENNTILSLFPKFGTRWSQYLPYLPGRSDNAVKNRYHVIRKNNFEDCSSSRAILAYKRSLSDHISLDSDTNTSKDGSSVETNRSNLRKLLNARDELDREILELERQCSTKDQSAPQKRCVSPSQQSKAEGVSAVSSESDFSFDFDWAVAEQSGP